MLSEQIPITKTQEKDPHFENLIIKAQYYNPDVKEDYLPVAPVQRLQLGDYNNELKWLDQKLKMANYDTPIYKLSSFGCNAIDAPEWFKFKYTVLPNLSFPVYGQTDNNDWFDQKYGGLRERLLSEDEYEKTKAIFKPAIEWKMNQNQNLNGSMKY